MRFPVLLLATLMSLFCHANDKIRVACLGNSVTYGYGLPNREQTCYPSVLQSMLGDAYEVRNFGHSGATLLRHGHNPYNLLPEYHAAIAFLAQDGAKRKGDIVVIHLGLNDTDPRNCPQRSEEFIPDYRTLIDSIRAASPNCKLYVCLMTPIFHGHRRFLSGTRDWHAKIQEAIKTVAYGAETEIIDLFTPLHCRPDLFPDNLHPNPKGAQILAETVYGAITAYRDQPLALPEIYQNGMVIQRNANNIIHGSAPAGSQIRLTFNKQKYATQANNHGKWEIALPPMTEGGPYRMDVSAEGRPTKKDKSRLTLDSIYIGEVWLCSGQSNMEWINANMPTERQPEICRSGKTDPIDARLHLLRMQGLRTISTGAAWSAEELEATNDLRFIKPYSWKTPDRESVRNFSAIAYRVARHLADSLGCHIGVICNAIGGSGIESWIDRWTTEYTMPEVLISARPAACDFMMDWVRRCIAENTQASTNPLQRHPFDPCYLYETSIRPLEGLTLRGVMWYQGESNAHNIKHYERQWKALTESWRHVFRSADNGPLPFYTMQLSAISGRPSWGRFRDMQRRLAENDARTYLVVSHDIGEAHNVHPAAKDVQGDRLAACILNHEYHKNIMGDSPRLVKANRGNACINMYFSEALSAADCANMNNGFEVAGPDGIFHAAEIKITNEKVVVSSPQVRCPSEVRYAWQDFTRARLLGQNSLLPVSTFSITLPNP